MNPVYVIALFEPLDEIIPMTSAIFRVLKNPFEGFPMSVFDVFFVDYEVRQTIGS